MIHAAVLIGALAASSGELTLDGWARDELRFGSALALGGGASSVGVEDALLLNVGLSYAKDGSQLTLRYDPQLMMPDIGEGNDVEGLNEGSLSYAFTTHSGKFRILLSEDAAYGTIDIFALTPTAISAPASTSPTTTAPGTTSPQTGAGLNVQAIPSANAIKYEASNSLLDMTLRPTTRLNFELGGGYLLNGGVNQPPRLQRPIASENVGAAGPIDFPLEQGPFGSLSGGYQVTHLDTLTTRLAGTDLRFSNGPLDLLFEATEQESHRFDRYLTMNVAAGYAEARFEPTFGYPGVLSGYPEASVGLTELRPTPDHHQLNTSVSASLGPLIDRLSGTIYESLQLLGRLEWTAPLGWSARMLVGINQPFYGNLRAAEDVQIVQGAIGYQPLRFLRVEAGAVGTWEEPTLLGGLSTQWLVFGAVVLQETVRE